MTSPTQLQECELLVARMVVRALGDRGIVAPKAEELVEDPELRAQDLSLLGLNSLDWIALATQLEDTISAEIPDHMLISPAHRCVAGWGEAVMDARTAQSKAPHRTH
ncbi:acyl carrier protein [Streptomyces sp. NPDC056308]|uniref:acyl carrier protein n=1 Tax=Streptomyces sp. NPDC056308 TaxID=3345780 RepID=UPI0035DFC520